MCAFARNSCPEHEIFGVTTGKRRASLVDDTDADSLAFQQLTTQTATHSPEYCRAVPKLPHLRVCLSGPPPGGAFSRWDLVSAAVCEPWRFDRTSASREKFGELCGLWLVIVMQRTARCRGKVSTSSRRISQRNRAR